MNDKRYRAALIGLGRIADTIDDEVIGDGWLVPFSHMGSYMDVPEVQVVGAADLYAEQREAFGERWTIEDAHLYENYEEMLEREKPDIVSICTSAAPRAKITLDIVRMVRERRTGVKCIWVEKPMAISLEEADAMVEGCREAGIILMMNAMRASDVYYRRARALIDEGALGKMLQITAHGAGNLSHMGVHWLGAMCVLAGGNERVSWVVGRWRATKKPQAIQILPVTPISRLKTVPVASAACCRAVHQHGRSTLSVKPARFTSAMPTMAMSLSCGGWDTSLTTRQPRRCGTSFHVPNASGVLVRGRSEMPLPVLKRAKRPTVPAIWDGICWNLPSLFVNRTAKAMCV